MGEIFDGALRQRAQGRDPPLPLRAFEETPESDSEGQEDLRRDVPSRASRGKKEGQEGSPIPRISGVHEEPHLQDQISRRTTPSRFGSKPHIILANPSFNSYSKLKN